MDDDVPVRHERAPDEGQRLPCHYTGCFGCGEGGLGMALFAGPGVSVTGTVEITAEHQGAPGLAHGGIVAAVMDETLGSLNWMLMRPAVTAQLTTNFRQPIPVGSSLHVSGWGVRVEGRKFFAEGEARLGGPEGPVVATGAALFVSVTTEHFRRHGRSEDVQRAAALHEWHPIEADS